MQLMPLIKGAATFIPGLYRAERGSTGGTVTARYCYSVWLRLLKTLSVPAGAQKLRNIAELGPGDSLGIGLAAVLSGACRLQSLDVVRYASVERNQAILYELARLFRAREPIPDDDEFPQLHPRIDSYRFPDDLLPESLLSETLAPDRVGRIAAAIAGSESDVSVDYLVPWNGKMELEGRKLDLVYSQAVLEHVEDLGATHIALARLVEPGGLAVHVIDFRCHGMTPGWDGHLQYSAPLWALVKGRRPYLLNRASPCEQLEFMQQAGFRTLTVNRVIQEPTLGLSDLAPEFRGWSEEDRCTATMTVVARRRSTHA